MRHVASGCEILTGLVDRLAKKSMYFAARKKRKLDDKSLRLYMRTTQASHGYCAF